MPGSKPPDTFQPQVRYRAQARWRSCPHRPGAARGVRPTITPRASSSGRSKHQTELGHSPRRHKWERPHQRFCLPTGCWEPGCSRQPCHGPAHTCLRQHPASPACQPRWGLLSVSAIWLTWDAADITKAPLPKPESWGLASAEQRCRKEVLPIFGSPSACPLRHH